MTSFLFWIIAYYIMVIYMDLEINKNLMRIDNYKQIKSIKSDLIELEEINIYGDDLKIIRLDGYSIVVKGVFKKIIMGIDKNDL